MAFTFELLHFTDQEANASTIDNIDNLSAILNALRDEDLGDDGVADNTLTLSSGDVIIPGLFFDASAAVFGSAGIADIQIQNELGLQAAALGNHEFDLGTGFLAGLIDGSAPGDFSALSGTALDGQDFQGALFPYLSANLGFSTDPNLAPLEVAGGRDTATLQNVVTSSSVSNVNGELIGIVGATVPTIDSISSAGSDIGIFPEGFSPSPTDAQLDALAAILQAEVDALLADNAGLDKVVLLSHMQQISIELALAERLEDVDIIVAGGSNTRLFDDNDRIRDGDSDQGQYPQFVTNAGGTTTAVVNTDANYKYVGRLVIDFDESGNILENSYDATVSGAYATDAQGVADLNAAGLIDPEIDAITDAIQAQIVATESNVFGVSDVFLNGNRSGTFTADDPDGVRTQETNLGNLTADANLVYANQIIADQGLGDPVVVSIKNGGGIRASIGEIVVPGGASEPVRVPNSPVVDADGNVVKPEGGISQNDIQTVLAFNNGLTLLDITKAELKAFLEGAVSALPTGVSGGFPQISGLKFSFDETRQAQTYDGSGNIETPGERVLNAGIFDQNDQLIAEIVRDGEIVGDAGESFRIVTLNFLANAGDEILSTLSNPNRVDLIDLDADGNDDGIATGSATFANDGTEQDALAEYLDDTFNPANGGAAYDEADTGPALDERIQNLTFREDTVLPEEGPFTLQILHASDLEGGIDAIFNAPNFAAIEAALEGGFENSLTISAGDNYISGPFFNAASDFATFNPLFEGFYNEFLGLTDVSQLPETADTDGNGFFDNGEIDAFLTGPDNTAGLVASDVYVTDVNGDGFPDYFDEIDNFQGRLDVSIMNRIGFDASALGNHEFDLGTDTLASIILYDSEEGNSLSSVNEQAILDEFPGAVNYLQEVDWPGIQFPYLSANLNFDADSSVGPLFTDDILEAGAFASDLLSARDNPADPSERGSDSRDDKIARSTFVDVNGEYVGIVGATTPLLESISSPGQVEVLPTSDLIADLAAIIQAEVDELLALDANGDGVGGDIDKIVLTSHLQQFAIESEQLAPLLSGVDIIIAGGSDTILADSEDVERGLQPGDEPDIDGYPVFAADMDGNPVALVTTDGEYTYVGRLVIAFDENGVVVPDSVDPAVSGAFATTEQGVIDLYDQDGALGDEDALAAAFGDGTPGGDVRDLVDAVVGVVNAQDGNIVGQSDVFLNGARADVRNQETNLGNLTADANIAAARLVEDEDTSPVLVSLKNGGGIRDIIGFVGQLDDGTVVQTTTRANPLAGKEEGDVSQLDIANTLRFNNGLVLVTVTPDQLLELLEHAVAAAVPDQSNAPGQFAQVGGLAFSFDPTRPAREFDPATLEQTSPGERVQSVALIDPEDGTLIQTIVEDGQVVDGAPDAIRVVTLDFLEGGGDQYPYPVFAAANTGENGTVDYDRVSLEEALAGQDGAFTFADAGSEQDALAEFFFDNFNEDEGGEPFDKADTPIARDTRIQNIDERNDTVLDAADGIVIGTDGDDVLPGSAEGDLIIGLDGNDELIGGDGDDTLLGDEGDDILDGGGGDDDLVGEEGDDILSGGPGSDNLVGGDGTDTADFSDLDRGITASLADGTAEYAVFSGSLAFLGDAAVETGTTFGGTEIGGLSGIDYNAANGTYVAISDDRGDPANGVLPRFYTLELNFDTGGFVDEDAVEFLAATNILDDFAAGGIFPAGGVDPEAIRIDPATGTLYWTSEGDADALIDPFVREMTASGIFLREFDLPAGFAPTADETTGIRDNLAFESLTLTQDGSTAFAALENALLQDGPAASIDEGSPSRVVRYDVATGAVTGQFVYQVDPIPQSPDPADAFADNGLVELLAIDDTTFIAVERSFAVGVGNTIKLFLASTDGATDVDGLESIAGESVVPMSKELLADLGELGAPLDNIEGITFGPEVDGKKTVVLVSDNNFNASQTTLFLVFTVEGDLALISETDQLVHIENLKGTAFADLLEGDDLANEILGLAGDDVIEGNDGDDLLDGGEGDDILDGGDGNDTLIGGAGNNDIDGGAGDGDVAVFAGERREFVVTRDGDSIVVAGKNGTTTVTNVETLRFDDIEIEVTEASDSSIELGVLGRFESGVFDEGAAEIVAYDPDAQRLFLSNADSGTVDVLSIADPTDPAKLFSIDPSLVVGENGGINSVAVSNGLLFGGNGIIAVAVEAEDEAGKGKVVLYDAGGFAFDDIEVGVLPDSLTFTPDGKTLLVANEGEPTDGTDPKGSISVIDLSGGFATATVKTIDFTAFDGQEDALREQGVRIFPDRPASEDFEPEFITASPDGKKAFVTLQENNAIAVIDLEKLAGFDTDLTPEQVLEVVEIQGLGTKDHGLPGNGLDANDKDGPDGDGAINIQPLPLAGLFMPDAVASYEVGGATYYVTANEGDGRGDYFEENDDDEIVGIDPTGDEARVGDLLAVGGAFGAVTLDEALIADLTDRGLIDDDPDTDLGLERLVVSVVDGDTDGDGDIDTLHAFGARSFTIWDEDGNLVFDSGDEFERITAEVFPEFFNSDNDENTFDTRSDAKGPEPEGVTVGEIDGQTYAFIGLERIGGVMVYNVTNPGLPEFVQYINPRDFTGDPEAGTAGDLGPEGLVFIGAEDSPNGEPLLVVTNEVSGSTTIYEIDLADATPLPAVAINEIRIDQPGSDTDEYFELAGEAGTSLDGLTYLVIGDGAGGSGTIEAVVDLTGQSIPDDGFFLAAEETFTPAGLVDLVTTLDFENSDNVTHLLVSGFTGSENDDLDTDDDGVLDLEPWDAVVDSVALLETPGSGDQVYSDTLIGPDGDFVPAHVFRETDRTGAFQIGDFDFGDDDTPGESNEVPPPALVSIPQIQGAGHVSPYVGQTVTTTGIVTAVDGNGFYLQDPDGDGDDATSDGIFVFTGGEPSVSVGDELEIAGEVSEFVPGGFDTGNLSGTQFAFPEITVLSSGNDLPAPVVLGSSGRVVPTETVISEDEIPLVDGEPGVAAIDLRDAADDAANTFDPAQDGIDFFESLEGMLVTVEDPVAVSATNRFGETWTLTNQGANISPADARTERDGIQLGINLSADAVDPDGYGDLNPERVQIQFDGGLLPDGFTAPDITNGDVLSDVTGVVGYSFGNFEVNVTESFTVTPSGLTQEVTDLAGTEDKLTVAAYNLLNVTSNPADGDGDQIARLADQIVNNLKSPDILALQEIQDDSGVTDDGTLSAENTLKAIVDAIKAAGGPDYKAVGAVVDEDGETGGIPGGNIRNAFLWNPDRVSADEDDIVTLEVEELTDFGVGNATAFDGTRDPLLGTFEFNGEEITLINNHLTSRFGSTPIYGGPQLFVQAGEDERQAETQALNDIVDAILADDPTANVVVLGDLNTFEFTDELTETLPGTGDDRVLSNLIAEALSEDDAYSFIFQGNSQVLDHIFVTDGLLPGAEADIVHVNTDFPEEGELFASDHEPVLARFSLGSLPEEVAETGDETYDEGGGSEGEGQGPNQADPAAGTIGLNVQFVSAQAGYNNTFGWYNAETGEAGLIFGALKGLPGLTGKQVEVSAEAPEDIGFFLIPDGYSKYADLIDDDPGLSFFLEEGKGRLQLATADETKTVGAYFTDESLNGDGEDHAVGGNGTDDLEDGPLGLIAWEDLPGLGDADYNDAILSVAAADEGEWQAFLAEAAAARLEEETEGQGGTAVNDDLV